MELPDLIDGCTDRHAGQCPICGPATFRVFGDWLRDQYLCEGCSSIPRMRQFVKVLEEQVPGWRSADILECSPAGPASDKLAAEAPGYTPSQFFEGVPSGTFVEGVRREDVRALSLADASLDVFASQDVFEHVLDPDTAWTEIARVLRPGGVHVWSIPVYSERSIVRAVPDALGEPRLLMEPDYHGNPLGGGSLVVHDWGPDVMARCDYVSGVVTTVHNTPSPVHGIQGAMLDVFVSRKPG